MKQIHKRKQSTKTNSGPFGTILPLFSDAQRTHITKDFLNKMKNISKQSGKQEVLSGRRNNLPLTTFSIDKKN